MTRGKISTVENTLSGGKSIRGGLEPVACKNALFKDSLLDSSIEHKRRTWTTLLSFVLQSFLTGILISLPLWFTDALPKQQLLTLLEAPPPPPPPPPPAVSTASAAKAVKVTSNVVEAHLRTPSRIPAKVQINKEDAAPPPAGVTDGVVGGVPGGTSGGELNGVIGGIVSSSSNVVPKLAKPPEPAVQRVRVSQGVTTGLLVSRIEPTYPTVAHEARVQGVVVLTAIIGKDGSVEHLQLASGNPLLVQAAIDAVKQWRYKPFLLNGHPIEIETTITVNFQIHSG